LQFQLAVKSVRKNVASIPLFNLVDFIMLVATEQTDIIILVFFLQGVDYLKYDNCNNGGIKPLDR